MLSQRLIRTDVRVVKDVTIRQKRRATKRFSQSRHDRSFAQGAERGCPVVARLAVAIAGMIVLSVTGCGEPRPSPVFRKDLAGIVMLDDQPLAGARVLLVPLNPDLGVDWKMSFGLTDDQGKFELKTRDEQPGAWSGRHLVIISKPLPRTDDAALAEFIPEFARPIDEVPERYNRLSELEIEIPPNGEVQALNFNLSSIDPLLRDL